MTTYNLLRCCLVPALLAGCSLNVAGQVTDEPQTVGQAQQEEPRTPEGVGYEGMQCGRACAAMALECFHIEYNNEELSSAMPVDSDGQVTALSIQEFLTAKGLLVEGVRTSPAVLLEKRPVAILYEQRERIEGSTKALRPHFTIVIAYDGHRVCLYNPDVTSPRTGWMSADEALHYWTGEALFISGENAGPPRAYSYSDTGSTGLLHVLGSTGKWIVLPLLPIACAIALRHAYGAARAQQGAAR